MQHKKINSLFKHLLNQIGKKNDIITTLEESFVPIEADDEFIYFEFPTHKLII